MQDEVDIEHVGCKNTINSKLPTPNFDAEIQCRSMHLVDWYDLDGNFKIKFHLARVKTIQAFKMSNNLHSQ